MKQEKKNGAHPESPGQLIVRVRLVLLTLLLILACLATARAQSIDDGFNAEVDPRRLGSMALQPDGKILIGGSFITVNGATRVGIARLNANGTLDIDFHPVVNSYLNSLALQPDGKIIIAGSFTKVDGQPRNRIARLNPNGSLDDSFFSAGPEHDSGYPYISGLAIQPDGRIVIGGRFQKVGGVTRTGIARLNANGALDTGFNPASIEEYDGEGEVAILALQPDGKIIIAGYFTKVGGQPRNRIARLNPNGSLDDSFFSAGPERDSSSNPFISGLAIQPDGRIFVSGLFNSFDGSPHIYNIARLNPNGSLDMAFDSQAGPNEYFYGMALQADGNILIGGHFTSVHNEPRQYIARLLLNGGLDSTFDLGDWPNSPVTSLALQPDGKILLGGNFTEVGGQQRRGIARLHNTSVAEQRLSLSGDRSTLTWTRDGTSPEFQRVTFELSTDGLSWSPLGQGTYFLYTMPSLVRGWRMDGLSLPKGQGITIRARGFYTTGLSNGSGSMAETILYRGGALPGVLMLMLDDEPVLLPPPPPIIE